VNVARFPLRIGVVILPEAPWATARRWWEGAEALGFDHAWTYDHLTWRGFRDTTWFGALPTLTAAALVTKRIRLGTLVASPNFRHPVPFAKELVTLDDISRGRLTLGIGAGGTGWDATALGEEPWTPRERAERFEEFVDLTDTLLRQPVTTAPGRFYRADEARTFPGCVQRPRLPFAVAGVGPTALRVAARHGQAWVTTGRGSEEPLSPREGAREFGGQLAQLEQACTAEGRDPATIDRLVLTGFSLPSALDSPESFADAAGVYAEAGVTDLIVHWPRPTEPFRADLAMFERIFGP
jgi:alkanesulfonate monooxygenase SsuD/methylene tetrahydromethanopterin reductase-like flavin-dependent oxidoreductase (luciferase family)